MAERLDGVDLLIGIPDAAVASVIIAFGLDTREPSERIIHLLESLPGTPAGLIVAGVTARLECSLSRCEVVVQLRPVRRARLGPDWAGFYSGSGHRLRLAEEWVATQRILVATLTASLATASHDTGDPASTPARASVAAQSARGLLSARHLDFLATCAGMVVLEDQLTLLGPIRERAWTLRHGDLRFRVRRWTAGLPASAHPLDLVELEAQTSAADAPFLFPALRSLARQHQVDTEAEASPMVVRALISAWANSYPDFRLAYVPGHHRAGAEMISKRIYLPDCGPFSVAKRHSEAKKATTQAFCHQPSLAPVFICDYG